VIDVKADLSLVILCVGVVIVLAMLAKSWLARIGVPSLVAYILLGLLLCHLDLRLGILSAEGQQIFDFLAQVGIITLLFRIGLESKIGGLLSQLRRASLIWSVDVLFSGAVGYGVARWVLGYPPIACLFIAVALTATSVGVSVIVWKERNALQSRPGELLIDVAELDDISAIILMALLFAVVPVLNEGSFDSVLWILLMAGGWLFIKLLAFGTGCALLAIYGERHLTHFFRKIESPPDPMLTVAGLGFIIAALAGWLGFSVAIGAFFAGLVFSRDPKALQIDRSFGALYDLFTPFFFIGIGLNINPSVLGEALGPGAILVLVAFLGKLIGNGIPVLLTVGKTESLLLGFSMVPRAEIAMIIMQRGLLLGSWAVPERAFAAMVMVSGVTCIAAPWVVRTLLPRKRKG